MLHWRVGVNPNHMVKGSGTWTAEEDERLSKLVEVVGMKVRQAASGSLAGLVDEAFCRVLFSVPWWWLCVWEMTAGMQ